MTRQLDLVPEREKSCLIKTVLSRPRTRLYEANYNIGESYYRPALDRLDRKYSGRPLSPPPRQSTPLNDIAERHSRIFADEDLDTSRTRASKHIRQENLFDSRGGRINRAALLDNFENDLNDETSSSISRLRASKKVSIIDDVGLEKTSNNLKTHRMLGRAGKILDSVGINESSARGLEDDSSYRRRALKVTYSPDEDDLTRWTPLEKSTSASMRARREENMSMTGRSEESSISSAAIRARQSKERLSDIEDEMAAMAEKQAVREARVARLRALVAETEAESADFEISQVKSERASARREKSSASQY